MSDEYELVCPRDADHGPHDDRARFCAVCGKPLERKEARAVRRFYCGCYYGPPLPPEGEPAECGWTGSVEVDLDAPATTCPKCGADLGPDDVQSFPATMLVHWPSGPVATCDEHGRQLIGLGNFMGSHTVATRLTEPAECVNCHTGGPPE